MALKVELKPGERIILGECLVTNGDQRTRLTIEGQVPIVREKYILALQLADTPAKRVYFAVQLMYTSKDPREHHEIYFSLVRELIEATPGARSYIESINDHILSGEMYQALKVAKTLISYEQELTHHAKPGATPQRSDRTDRQPS
jgi:flagellar protein FlbT